MQNKALRVIYSKKAWKGTNQAHITSGLLYLEQRRKASLLKYAHNLSYDHTKLKDTPTRNLRSAGKILLKTPAPKTKKYERSFYHQSLKMWNDLPEDYKAIRNFKLFKTRVKSELLLNNINFPE